MVVIAPLPLSVSNTANAAAIPVASGTWSQGSQIQLIFGYSLATANPPALTSFDVRVDDVANPVTAISFLGTILYLTLTSTVYSGSVIKVSYSAPAVDNTTNNAALQSSSGNDTESFPNLLINNDAGSKPVPNKPGVPSVVAGEESATITVTAPSGGVTPTSYEVTATPGGAKCTVTGASGSCTISGLTAGTAYTFTTVAKRSGFDSPASAASASVTALAKTATETVPAGTTDTVPAGYRPSWDKEPLTDSETDANTVGYMPTTSPGNIIITDEFGFTLDKNNGIKPKIRMKNYAGKIKMSISATYKVGAKNVKYKCAFKPFGTTKKIKTAKWRWYSPKKACVLPAPLVAAIRANKATLSTSGKWTRQALTTGKKVRADNSKIKARNLKYTVKAKL